MNTNDTADEISNPLVRSAYLYFVAMDNSKATVMQTFLDEYGDWTVFNKQYPNNSAQYEYTGPTPYSALPNTPGSYTNQQVYKMLWVNTNSLAIQETDGHHQTFTEWFDAGVDGDSIPIYTF